MKIKWYLQSIGCLVTASLAFAAGEPQSKQPEQPVKAVESQPGPWQPLFDGKTLGNWKASEFTDNGKIEVSDGTIRIGVGKPMSGITWSSEPPVRMNYEIELEAMRTEGSDFFCGLTFPVGKDPCTFICGGWGGTLVGLSSIDGNDASENSTATVASFEDKHWYKIRIRVTKTQIEAWIDEDRFVSLELEDHKIGIRWEVEPAVPLGVSTYRTGSALRNIRWRKVD
jgi:hypothetical protein